MIVATNIVKPENKQGYEISGADGYENATEELEFLKEAMVKLVKEN